MKPPSVSRKTLVLAAGMFWSLGGLILVIIGCRRFLISAGGILPFIVAGILGGITIYYFGFSRLAGVNLARIYNQAPGKEKVCIFAFQNVRSYLIVIIMMTAGYGLRHSALPRNYLAAIYMGIGLALILASMDYYRHLV